MQMKNYVLTASLLLLLLSTGCGYHTAGQAAKLPAGIHTIAIPTFANNTQNYRIEQILTAAVVRMIGIEVVAELSAVGGIDRMQVARPLDCAFDLR